jgi:hypothetical protein
VSMTTGDLKATYSRRRETFQRSLETTNRRINRISNLRLGVALLFLLFIYLTFSQSYFGFLVAVSLLIFLVLVKKHALLFSEKTHLENLVVINSNEEKALAGDVSSLSPGTEFVDGQHPYTHDLDVFGEGSLYQYMNRCNTLQGKRNFANALANPLQSKGQIVERQEAVRDLTDRIDFRQHFQAAGMETGEQAQDFQQLLDWLKHPPFLRTGNLLRIVLIVVPVITIVFILLSVIFPAFKVGITGMVLIQWSITAVYLKKINIFHDYISRKKNILQKYATLLLYLEREEFKAENLSVYSKNANEGHTRVRKLASLVSALDARTNSIATLIVNSVLLYDLQCVYRLEKWKMENAKRLPIWLDTITEVETLVSFSTFAFNNPSFKYAVISEDLHIGGSQLAHPLISEEERIANEFSIGPSPSVLIITGANMAGKSTFLRTLGVNLILALNGAPVCAASFVCPIISLRTGMRTADSLKDHQSYFYAELNRLKSIMDELRSNKPLLILLDEILKGTNSNDKQSGSIALVKQLLPHPCLAIIATHDLALGELEKQYDGKVKNYCFEANIEDDQLSFDYKLKEGTAQKMNASFLMRKMGIIPA